MHKNIRRKSLRKNERLYGKNALDALFDRGRTIFAAPVRAVYLIEKNKTNDNTEPLRAAFSVPSKSFKRAVDRNLLKRRMREAYRKNKNDTADSARQANLNCTVMFIYTAKEILPYSEIEAKLLVTLQHLHKKIGNEKGADRAN